MEKKKKTTPPECPPLTYHFTNLTEMMTEVRVHASRQRQVAIAWDDTNQHWSMTIFGAKL